MNRTRNMRRNVKRRRLSKRSGGIGSLVREVGSIVTPNYATPFVAADMTRATAALVRNTNQAYRFYKHCRAILPSIHQGELKHLFETGVNDLEAALDNVLHTSFLTKYGAILRGTVLRDVNIKTDLRIFEENLKHHKSRTRTNPSMLAKIYNASLIFKWADWYRYELNMLKTNLLALISEITMFNKSKMKTKLE